MKLSASKYCLIIFCALAAILPASGQGPRKFDKKQAAAQVKSEFLHAWNGYKKYAWGHDDLKPLSKTHRDWYDGQPILMTQVDSLDSLILMGFKEEAETTKKYILANLSFEDRKSTRLNSSHTDISRMPSS